LIRTLRVILAFLVIAALAGCGSDSGSDGTASGTSENASKTTPAINADTPVPTKPPIAPKGPPPKNLVIKDIEVGTGPGLKKNDKFLINYRAFDYDDGGVNETKWGDTAFPWILGIEELVPALEKGLVGMKVGGKRELIAPSKDLYGAAPRIYVIERLA
jgi:peptidylprolyl isomerase